MQLLTSRQFAKLSPMVYSALQIITRGRYEGISVVGLGQKSKYDQKTCFYLVRQLVDLDLVFVVSFFISNGESPADLNGHA